MPILKYRKRSLEPLARLVPEISYVMCGARGESGSKLMRSLPQMRFFGFEPDPAECARLSAQAQPGFTYFPAAVGGRHERRTLYVTRNAACSSLLPPNHEFLKPYGAAASFDVVQELLVDIVALDEYLPAAGVDHVDFLDLDTQGSELEILQGARGLLAAGAVVVKCEVEFAPFYRDQPLFGDVDRFLRELGFQLFDLSRSRYRRSALPRHILTRGQLLWGDAVYLRDYKQLATKNDALPILKLCLLAAQLQFHDYALEILEHLCGHPALGLTMEEKVALERSRVQFLQDLKRSARWTKVLGAAFGIGLAGPIKEVGRLFSQLGDRLKRDGDMTGMNWED